MPDISRVSGNKRIVVPKEFFGAKERGKRFELGYYFYIGDRDTDAATGTMAEWSTTVVAVPVMVMFGCGGGLSSSRTSFTAIFVIVAGQHGNYCQVEGPYDDKPLHCCYKCKTYFQSGILQLFIFCKEYGIKSFLFSFDYMRLVSRSVLTK
ncbi:MAG: hypothetical protein EOP54_02025 [Sphingobacteriales bacterium]|nr:MAG: hypothetical protein EOP54_02025 [Sphingobacteriales bacterium]